MRVIGTAGHVDHGKTTLIEALTGINPDRLPEEKARGMTIDLGFAWFAAEDGEPIGVIDVPGHERFIRNMVAGAWSLDCALLLVAADDGWMRQTQDHALVLSALGVPAVILVVTKIDVASPERVTAVAHEARARCETIFGSSPPVVEVAAIARRGIEALKTCISETLAHLAARRNDGSFPYLYVDRVFSMKGAGLVVTGSLVGGPIGREQELVLLPQGEAVRVRGLQTYNAAVDSASPTCRLALNLPRTRSEVARGNCLTVRGAPFACETRIVARITPVAADERDGLLDEEKPLIRNHGEIEIALGTGHEIAQLHFMDDRRFARLELRAPLPALWNQPFLIIRHGGSTILGSGRALWFGEVPREDRRRMAGVLGGLPEPSRPEDRLLLQLRFGGFMRAPTEGTAPSFDGEGVAAAGWIFHGPWLESLAARVAALAAQPAGISFGELEGKLAIDGDALKAALALLVERAWLHPARGLYFAKPPGDGAELSPIARRLMAEIDAAGSTAFDATRTGIEGGQRELKSLVRLGLVVPLEDGLCYGKTAYATITATMLEGRKTGDRFTIQDARERTGLSRKYMLPLLNRMERDGMIRRDGDARVVLAASPKGPGASPDSRGS